ncbi:hypothetical protein [Streptomyces sp. NBRC 110028]|uniref:hypothetical protein n=1 Tax=Streptomyces sp. NBRC 110028 TaxID=1621260 RepID=UPI0006E32031|nr:hypothetical protein [Streptomyces sp. NBRC 110028]
MTWRRLFGFTVALTLLIWITSRLGVALHESSHLLVSGLLGADIAGLHVPLFGDGYGNFSFAGDTGATPRFLALIIGPMSHILGGVITMLLSRIPFRSRWLRLFLITYGAVNLLAGLQYLGSGLYYGYGDPADALIAYLPPCRPHPVSADVVTTIATVVVIGTLGVSAYFLTRDYLAVQELWFPAGSQRVRFRTLLLTAVPAVAIFIGAFMLSGSESPTFYAGGDSRWNEPVRDYQIATGIAADLRAHPDADAADSCRRAANDYVNVFIGDRETEHQQTLNELRSRGVPPEPTGKLPLLPVSAALLALGACLALLRSGRAAHELVGHDAN